MKSKFFFLMLLVATIVTGCSKDDDDNVTPGPETAAGGKMSVTVVFAPGQLGDMGYADNVLEGLFRLKELDRSLKPDSLDVNYITAEDIEATKEALDEFYYNYEDGEGGIFKRRLLVLTEPFMLDWIEAEKTSFDERDEILVLKMNKDDVAAAAQKMEMGSRLHGLNISAASSARRYCKFIQETMEDDSSLNSDVMVFFRLYDPEEVIYRDSISQVLAEELGDKTFVASWSMASTVGDAVFTDDGQTTILQEAFRCGKIMANYSTENSCPFHVADLGSAAAGLNYYFLGDVMTNIQMLALDTQMTSKLWIRRDFGAAFYKWCVEWMRAEQTGAMPAIQEFGGWNSNYVTDNIMLKEDYIQY